MFKLANLSLFENLLCSNSMISQNSVFNEEDKDSDKDTDFGDAPESEDLDDDLPDPPKPKRLPGIGKIRGRGVGSTHYYTFHGDGEHPLRGRGKGTNFSYTFGDGDDDFDEDDFDADELFPGWDSPAGFMAPDFGMESMLRRVNKIMSSLPKPDDKEPDVLDDEKALSPKMLRRKMEIQELLDRWKREDDEEVDGVGDITYKREVW